MAVSTIQDDKKKALNLAIAQIEKSCGKGSIMKMGSDSKVRGEAIPTGAINLDAAIGVGGIRRGRITEVYGWEGAQVLCVSAPRHPAYRAGEGEGGRDRIARPREGGEEQGRAAVQAGRVRHYVRRGDQPHLASRRHRRRGRD